MWLPDGEKSLMTRLAVSTQHRRVTDVQTDKHLAIIPAIHSIVR